MSRIALVVTPCSVAKALQEAVSPLLAKIRRTVSAESVARLRGIFLTLFPAAPPAAVVACVRANEPAVGGASSAFREAENPVASSSRSLSWSRKAIASSKISRDFLPERGKGTQPKYQRD